MKDPSTRRRYTLEFKEQAVKRVLSGHGVAAVARDLGISDSLTTTGWPVTVSRPGRVLCRQSRRQRLPA